MPHKIEGSWMETVTPEKDPAFRTLLTYDATGGLTGTGSIDLSPSTLTGPSHGVWERTGEHTFRWTLRAFAFSKDGEPCGMYVIGEDIALDEQGDSYSGSGSYKIVDGERVLGGGPFTVRAQRIRLSPGGTT